MPMTKMLDGYCNWTKRLVGH